jgi:hypothetical protein
MSNWNTEIILLSFYTNLQLDLNFASRRTNYHAKWQKCTHLSKTASWKCINLHHQAVDLSLVTCIHQGCIWSELIFLEYIKLKSLTFRLELCSITVGSGDFPGWTCWSTCLCKELWVHSWPHCSEGCLPDFDQLCSHWTWPLCRDLCFNMLITGCEDLVLQTTHKVF